jgi:hypothetical protein
MRELERTIDRGIAKDSAAPRRSASTSARALIETLAHSFAVCTHYVSQRAQRLPVASELPPALERIVSTLEQGSHAWVAWADEQTTRFIVAELAANQAQQKSNETVRLSFYDEDGRHMATGEWTVDSGRHWTLCKL